MARLVSGTSRAQRMRFVGCRHVVDTGKDATRRLPAATGEPRRADVWICGGHACGQSLLPRISQYAGRVALIPFSSPRGGRYRAL